MSTGTCTIYITFVCFQGDEIDLAVSQDFSSVIFTPYNFRPSTLKISFASSGIRPDTDMFKS